MLEWITSSAQEGKLFNFIGQQPEFVCPLKWNDFLYMRQSFLNWYSLSRGFCFLVNNTTSHFVWYFTTIMLLRCKFLKQFSIVLWLPIFEITGVKCYLFYCMSVRNYFYLFASIRRLCDNFTLLSPIFLYCPAFFTYKQGRN